MFYSALLPSLLVLLVYSTDGGCHFVQCGQNSKGEIPSHFTSCSYIPSGHNIQDGVADLKVEVIGDGVLPEMTTSEEIKVSCKLMTSLLPW